MLRLNDHNEEVAFKVLERHGGNRNDAVQDMVKHQVNPDTAERVVSRVYHRIRQVHIVSGSIKLGIGVALLVAGILWLLWHPHGIAYLPIVVGLVACLLGGYDLLLNRRCPRLAD